MKLDKFRFFLILSSLVCFSLADDVCTNKDCGEGHCVPDSIVTFHCECNHGWKAARLGPMIFGSCILPDCTLNFECGNGAPPPPSPPLPPLNFTSPCNFVWCGEGNCVVNGTGHYCQCYDGSANVFDNPAWVCLKQCYYEGDCNHLGLGSPSTSSNGWNDARFHLKQLLPVIIAVLTTTFLTRSSI